MKDHTDKLYRSTALAAKVNQVLHKRLRLAQERYAERTGKLWKEHREQRRGCRAHVVLEYRQRREHEADEERAAVTHEDTRGIEVQSQKARESADEGGEDEAEKDLLDREGVQGQDGGGADGDRGRRHPSS